MTEAEIMKALECCIKSNHFGECFENGCPLVNEEGCKVGEETLYPHLFDLINRKNAEIAGFKTLTNKTFVARIIREFLEKAKSKAKKGRGFLGNAYYSVSVDDLDQIAKEMGVEL